MKMFMSLLIVVCLANPLLAQYRPACGVFRAMFGCRPIQQPLPIENGPDLSQVIQLIQLAQENDLTVRDVVEIVRLAREGEIAGIQPVPLPSLPGDGQLDDATLGLLLGAIRDRCGDGAAPLPSLPPSNPQINILSRGGRVQPVPVVRYPYSRSGLRIRLK